VNVRNATDLERLPHAAITLLQQSGFSYGEGYSFDIEVAYENDSPMRLDESAIVIEEDREDLREAAEAIREVLGRGTIVEETSNENGWRYAGDILLVLGADCLDPFSNRVLFSSDEPDYPETQQEEYLVSIRNATGQRLLADSIMKRLDAVGLSYAEGYIYTTGNVYQHDYPIRLAESSLVIKENREDLREIAKTMREIIGTGTIIEENSGNGWEYDGDILIVLGDDCTVDDQVS
ncbi:MAG: LytR C-terminal domain-containing protein, partial [Coriobacteriales bacterium]|nr:LytR C-terminal domain-containing protein [Coriobacteriales bacterium]